MKVLIKICHYLVKISLVFGVKNPNSELSSTNILDLAKKLSFIIFLDYANFIWEFIPKFVLLTLLSLFTPSIILFLLMDTRLFTKSCLPVILSIEINRAVIWLKL